MIACPSCKRRVFTGREMLHASLDGGVECPVCGAIAQLDRLSRWTVACMLSILLPMLLLTANVFYSGHLLVVSMLFIVVAWRVFTSIGLPILALEPLPGGVCLNRKQSIATFAILLIAAVVMDAMISARIDADNAKADTRAVSADVKSQ